MLYICPLATEHCGYFILLFFFSCHLCMMSVLYFVDATTTFCGPLGTIKESILFFFFLSSLCFFTVSPFWSPLFSDCLLVSRFPLSSFPLAGVLCVGFSNLSFCVRMLLVVCVCVVVVALLCYGTEKLSFSQSAALWKPCA